jgi:hypothetical protein
MARPRNLTDRIPEVLAAVCATGLAPVAWLSTIGAAINEYFGSTTLTRGVIGMGAVVAAVLGLIGTVRGFRALRLVDNDPRPTQLRSDEVLDLVAIESAPRRRMRSPAIFVLLSTLLVCIVAIASITSTRWLRDLTLATGMPLLSLLAMHPVPQWWKRSHAARPLPLHVPPDWRRRCIVALTNDRVRQWRPLLPFQLIFRFLKSNVNIIALALVTAPLLGAVAKEIYPGSLMRDLKLLFAPFSPIIPKRDFYDFALVSVAMMGFAVAMGYRGRRYKHLFAQSALGLDAAEAIANAACPPILYLRAFDFDSMATQDLFHHFNASVSSESLLADLLSRFGPVLAIGRPGEGEPMHGAIRIYVEDVFWRRKIEELVLCCQFVVLGHRSNSRSPMGN